MTDIQAAIGLVQLRRLPAIVAQRRELRRPLPGAAGRRARAAHGRATPADGTTNFQSFWVLLPDVGAACQRGARRAVARHGVSARRGIMAAHLEPAYAGHPHAPLPVTERLTARTLILPLHHDLTDADQDVVVAALAAAIGLQSGVPSYR